MAPCYGKFYVDLPGLGRKRRTIALGACRTKSVARQKLREYLEQEGVNSKQAFHQNNAPATTFREQAEWWIASLSTRKRRPVKPATVSGWQDALNAWLLPHLGDRLVADVSNKAMRELVEKMAAAGLAAKTIVSYVQVVKLVLASAVDEEGEQIYPRKWNHDFIQLSIVCREKQHRPAVTDADLNRTLPKVKSGTARSLHFWRERGFGSVKRWHCAPPTSGRTSACFTSDAVSGVDRSSNQKRQTRSEPWIFRQNWRSSLKRMQQAKVTCCLAQRRDGH